MSSKENQWLGWMGLLAVLLLVGGGALWFFSPGRQDPGYESTMILYNVTTAPGSTVAGVEAMARAAGYVAVSNAAFNDLIPADKRSSSYDRAAVYRFATTNSGDTRLLAVPANPERCFLYFESSGTINFVQTNERAVAQFVKKLEGL